MAGSLQNVSYFGTCWTSPEVNSSNNRVFGLKAFRNKGLQDIRRDIYATVGLILLLFILTRDITPMRWVIHVHDNFINAERPFLAYSVEKL